MGYVVLKYRALDEPIPAGMHRSFKAWLQLIRV